MSKKIIEQGSLSDYGEVAALYDALNDALATGVNYPGWKKHVYPTGETASEGIAGQCLFVCRIDGKLAGTVVLNSCQYAAYRDAKWTIDAPHDKVLVVHTLAVHPGYKRQGVAQELLWYADTLAEKTGMATIRLDTSIYNKPAQALYEKCGYVQAGTVDLGLNIPDLKWFYCYEKKVSASEDGKVASPANRSYQF